MRLLEAHIESLKTRQSAYQHEKRWSNSILSNSEFTHVVKRLVNSWSFEAFFTFVIFTNSAFIGVEVHFMAHNPGPAPASFFVVDQVYAGIFFIELGLRIMAERRSFFWSSQNMAWNYLDILINITSVLNIVTAIVQQGEGDSDTLRTSGNVRIIRILRLTRVIRVVRVVKIVRFIRALRSLVYSIFGTLKVLLWSVLLLLMIMRLFKRAL